MSPDRRTLLALFSIAFGLRVLYAALVGTDPEMNPSPGTYDYYLAERMHDNLEWVGEPFTPRAPGYPVVLAAAFRVFGVRQWVAILLQAFFGAATALFLYRIGEKRLGRGVGLLSAIWLAAFVHQMHFASIFVRETLTTFALAWFTYTLVRSFHRMRQALWAGLVYTILIHIDAQFFVVFPVVVVFLTFFATRHRLLNLQFTTLFVSAVLVLTLPWTIRNYAVYGEVLPVSLGAQEYLRPINALISHETPRGESATRTPAGARVVRAHEGGFAANTVEFWRVTRLRDSPGDPERGIRAEPAWSLRHNAVNAVNFGLLLPFFAVGVVFGLVRRNRGALVLTVLIATHWLTHAFLGAEETSRLVVEPLVTLVAFYGAFELVRVVRKKPAPAPSPAPAR